MTPRRIIAGFFIRLIVLYSALMAAWPILKTPYAEFHRALGNLCLSKLGSGGSARFEPWPAEDEIKDTLVRLENHTVPGAKIAKLMPISTRYTGYMPTVVLVSLTLATPLPWSRRLFALVVGLVLVNAFIVGWLGISVIDDLSDPLPQIPTHGFTLPPAVKSVVRFLVENVVESVNACAYIVPIFIWIVSAFRRKDRERLLAAFLPTAPQADSSGKAG